MKNNYIKEFLIRGIAFGGLGPIVLGIVFMILGFCKINLILEGWQIFLAISTTYLLAFVVAGSSVFEQIEEWSNFKSLLIHMLTIYIAYLLTYLINNWIPFNLTIISIFSITLIVTFLIIWLICYLINKNYSKQLNLLVDIINKQ